jgi:hypothetical protein
MGAHLLLKQEIVDINLQVKAIIQVSVFWSLYAFFPIKI